MVPTNKLIVGGLIIVLMMALMLFKIPIGIAMTGSAIFGLYILVGPNAVVGSLKEVVFTSFASWSLSVIPMFVLMGVAMGKSGLMSGAYDSARKWLSRLPGDWLSPRTSPVPGWLPPAAARSASPMRLAGCRSRR